MIRLFIPSGFRVSRGMGYCYECLIEAHTIVSANHIEYRKVRHRTRPKLREALIGRALNAILQARASPPTARCLVGKSPMGKKEKRVHYTT